MYRHTRPYIPGLHYANLRHNHMQKDIYDAHNLANYMHNVVLILHNGQDV